MLRNWFTRLTRTSTQQTAQPQTKYQEFSKSLESKLATYSGGQFELGFAMPYRLALENDIWGNDVLSDDEETWFQATVGNASHMISFGVRAETADVVWKILGCHILSRLPNEAAKETIESLSDLYDFYTAKPQHVLPQPRTEHVSGIVVKDRVG